MNETEDHQHHSQNEVIVGTGAWLNDGRVCQSWWLTHHNNILENNIIVYMSMCMCVCVFTRSEFALLTHSLQASTLRILLFADTKFSEISDLPNFR